MSAQSGRSARDGLTLALTLAASALMLALAPPRDDERREGRAAIRRRSGRSGADPLGLGLAVALGVAVFVVARRLGVESRARGLSSDPAPAPTQSRAAAIGGYALGYALALALTVAAFALVRWPRFSPDATLAVILGLALVQMVVHFRFFLHVDLRRAARDNLLLILFSALIISLMVAGALVVLFNLHARMM